MRAPTLAWAAFLVRDYDEAIDWFVERLGFTLLEDTPLENGKRWVLVGRTGERGVALLLAKASTDEQRDAIGHAAGGRVAFFLHTENFAADYARLLARDVEFLEQPRRESYGTVAVFVDL